MRLLVTGATGYVGGELVPELLRRGHEVRALSRSGKAIAGVEVFRGDVVTGEGLAEARDGVDAAVYLVHSMGRGNPKDFAERDRQAARTFGDAAGDARVIYLGGLEGDESEHLRSRHEVAELLAERVDRLVYVRAAMVLGAGSESFVIMSKLVERLPFMITPRWVDTKTQPVALRDVVDTLAALAEHPDPPAEVQLGGADVLTYREMVRRVATLRGRRQPLMVPVPLFTPRLSSYWVALVTPVELGLVKPLVEGLISETVVATPPPPGLNDAPLGFDEAVRAALAA